MKKIEVKNQNGFTQISIIIAIVIGILVVGSAGYLGIKQYKDYQAKQQAKQIENEKIAQEVQQQKDLEVEKLKQEVEALKSKQSQLQNSYSPPTTQQKEDSVVADPDIDDFLTAVGQLICFNPDNNEKNIGSGFLWRESNTFSVFTNRHVFEGKKNCLFVINHTPTDQKRWGTYYLDVSSYYQWNSRTDFGFFYLTNDQKNRIEDNQDSANVENLNYSISSLPLCSAKAKQGAKVYIIGYPSYANNGLTPTRIVTEGIISGYKPTFIDGSPSFPDYYVSNKIDSGNSGGAALSIEDNHFCLLGITTWLSLGDYETQGIVQNICSVFLKDSGIPIKNPFEGLFK